MGARAVLHRHVGQHCGGCGIRWRNTDLLLLPLPKARKNHLRRLLGHVPMMPVLRSKCAMFPSALREGQNNAGRFPDFGAALPGVGGGG